IASSSFADQDSLRHAIDKARFEDRESLKNNTGYDDPKQRVDQVVSKAVLASDDAKVVVDAVAKELAIPPAAAAPLIEVCLRQNDLPLERDKEVDALAEEAVRLAPHNVYVLAFYAGIYGMFGSSEEFGTRMLPLVHDLPP